MNELATQQSSFQPPALLQGVESAATAAASKARALVEARCFMAMRNPRNWDQVRQDLLKECKRPAFAHNKSAFYIKPIGAGVEGLGIRFVEVALRCMTNVMVESETVFEDATKEVHRITVTDLQSNVPWSLDVPVSKTVERSKPSDDGSYISMRKNSWGKPVYTVPAEGDELLNKRGALISKAVRTLGLRIIPGDLQDEAEEIIKRIRLDEAARDPDAERKKIIDAFGDLHIKASQLVEYLGHDIGSCSPAELVELRGLYGAIKDGEATWASVMANKADNENGSGGSGGSDDKTPAPKTLPGYPDADFAGNLPGWHKAIDAKKKTADAIIATLQSKHTLTNAQRAQIKREEASSEKLTSDPDGVIVMTYAQVADRLNKADTLDKLAEAASLISAVADKTQHAELTAIYDRRGAEFK
jgi:hypothetical protein